MSKYVTFKTVENIPRIPAEAKFNITYRCNNNCRHCWLRIPSNSPEKQKELSLEEIKGIVDEARKLGCRRWYISGGEPMLRPDFIEIFDYIIKNCASYLLSTNGTLITPKIAQLMKKRGAKMVSLYGATAKVHDHITRRPGSFEAATRGLSYLKEANVGFTVQITPMRDNYHQFDKMIDLAKSLSPRWKIGASWFYLSACGDSVRNQEIIRQRLHPKDIVEIANPNMSCENQARKEKKQHHNNASKNYLFSSCINSRRFFHIDPYGQASFCRFITEESFRYDLRKGSLLECWEKFIPSLAKKITPNEEYLKNCGSCQLKENCWGCPVHSYLEHGRFSAKIDYLCGIAKEIKKGKENWKNNHRRYYKIADITMQVESDLPITDNTFHPKFKFFEVDKPGDDIISIRHYSSLPKLDNKNLGKKFYHKTPWAIYKKENSWIYLGIMPKIMNEAVYKVAVFNHDHTKVRIYNDGKKRFSKNNLGSLTLFATDQTLIARLLADRQGCYLHSSSVILEGNGLLFVGHSDAGKSTITKMLKKKAEILCDDRIIVRRQPEGFRVYGTWSHGEIQNVSSSSAPLKAVLFLEKDKTNSIVQFDDKKEIMRRLLACIIKPFVTADWWQKELSLLEKIAVEVPCYSLHFDKSGKIVGLLENLIKR